MNFNHNALIIDQSAFTRERIQARLDDLGFNNIHIDVTYCSTLCDFGYFGECS